MERRDALLRRSQSPHGLGVGRCPPPKSGGACIAVIWPLPTHPENPVMEIEFYRFRRFYWQLSRHAVSFLSLRCEWSPSAVV